MRRVRASRILIVLALAAVPVAVAAALFILRGAPAPEAEAQADGPTLTEMVPMDDGVRLATDVYLPGGDGPFPTLLARTPYNKDRYGYLRYANDLGAALVVQDMRGRYASEGEDPAFHTDAADGQATLRWVAAQPWSNGVIATTGASAMGAAQYLMAPDAPDALRCQWSDFAFSDLYRHKVFPGGLYRLQLVEEWLERQGNLPMLETWEQHPLLDDYWAAASITGQYGRIHVPAVHLSGWYDPFLLGTLEAFNGYQEQGGAGAAGAQYLIVGPWTHDRINPEQGEVTFVGNAGLDRASLIPAWLRWCFYGENTGVEAWPAVRYYTMGALGEAGAPGNEWREADAWPVPATETAFYLGADGSLSAAMPAEEGSDSYVHDPNDPVPTVGGANIGPESGPFDQTPIEGREDVLVYTTPPLASPVAVTGVVRARIWLASDAPDTDIIVRLTDVYPDGRSMLVTDGGLRARFRDGDYTRESFLTPGTPYELTFDVGATSIVFNAGHRIRIIVASSNAPRFEPNPGLAETWRAGAWLDAARPATNTILRGPAHPSALLLPVVDG
ncbi:MAG: CocE/NonD family hydrolase [Anaerolineae bacterium]